MADALTNLVWTCGPELYALFMRLTLRADRAEELMQELFLKLHASQAFAKARDPRAYAFRAAIHLAFDARRREKPAAALPELLSAPDSAPLETLIQQEEAQRVLAALAELSPLAREAAVLHFIQQHTFEEAGQLMEKSAHQVRGLCQDALRQLKIAFHVPAREVSRD